MDPVSAIGLASAIITFVEFSWTLVKGTGDIYKSPTGYSRENASIGTVIADLEEVTRSINTDIRGRDKHENALVVLAEQCESLSKELLQALGKLKKTGDSKREALKLALKSMRKEKEIASIEKRLGEYRVEIVIRLNLVLW